MNLGLQFYGPVFDISGIANALRNTAIALYDIGVPVHIVEIQNWSGLKATLDIVTAQKLEAIMHNPIPKEHLFINYIPPTRLINKEGPIANISYSLFETDSVPAIWPMIIDKEKIKEVWVPTTFNKESFAHGGIPADKLHVLPMGIDLERFNPDVEPVPLRGAKAFKFLTIMDVKECKGYDILLDAYFQEFSSKDDVCLIFKGYSGNLEKESQQKIQTIIKQFKDKHKSTATVIFVGGNIDDNYIPGLHKAADCYILPSKGEGWSLGTIQSMAVGVPAIMTRATGYLDYMNDSNGIFLECEKKPIKSISWLIREPYQQGHCWYETTVEETRKKMRWAYEHKSELTKLGTKASEDVKEFTWEKAAQKIVNRAILTANEAK